ncbi:MAG TPA: CinA family protein [Candidatus Dormibacteraeota bacterium]|nr:CinA family protein [Candidatus Dormibacteraeota bacterium]
MTEPVLLDLALTFPEAQHVLQQAGGDPPRTLATAESCTGGLLAAALTAVAGSSRSFLGGVVAYAYSQKTELLGVPIQLLDAHGAVSQEVAEAMALRVRDRFHSTFGISTTGVAGPGSSESKPAGLVYVAVAGPQGTEVRRLDQDLGRHLNRVGAVHAALDLVLMALS